MCRLTLADHVRYWLWSRNQTCFWHNMVCACLVPAKSHGIFRGQNFYGCPYGPIWFIIIYVAYTSVFAGLLHTSYCLGLYWLNRWMRLKVMFSFAESSTVTIVLMYITQTKCKSLLNQSMDISIERSACISSIFCPYLWVEIYILF